MDPWVPIPADPRTNEADQWYFDGEEVTYLHPRFADETLTTAPGNRTGYGWAYRSLDSGAEGDCDCIDVRRTVHLFCEAESVA